MTHNANSVLTSGQDHLNVVLGAAGGAGRAIVEALLQQGASVRGVGRNEPEWARRLTQADQQRFSWRRADLEDPAGAVAACAGGTTVYFAAQPPYGEWRERFPRMTANVLDGCETAGAKLVMVDNLYMYGPTAKGPLVENTPRAATGTKGLARAKMEEQLMAAHRAGKVRVTIGRLSDYYGPNASNTTVSALVLEKAVAGKAMQWPGRADQARTLHYVGDAARALIVIGESSEADGRVWHLPAAAPLTGQNFMDLVNTQLAAPVKTKTIGTLMMRIGGLFSAEAKETVECMYQWTAPFISDSTAFTNTFGEFAVTPHAIAVQTTVASMRHA